MGSPTGKIYPKTERVLTDGGAEKLSDKSNTMAFSRALRGIVSTRNGPELRDIGLSIGKSLGQFRPAGGAVKLVRTRLSTM